MKRTTSLIAGSALSLSLIIAGSPAAQAAPVFTGVSQMADAAVFAAAKSRVKVTLNHTDNDGRVIAGVPMVLKGKVTGERAGQTVYLEEKTTVAGKTRWKVVDKIRHNGRYSFTVIPDHGVNEFRARVKTKGVKGTQPVKLRMKAAAPTGGDATSGTVTVRAVTEYGIYIENSIQPEGQIEGAVPLTFNYSVTTSDGSTSSNSAQVSGARATVGVRVPSDAALTWSITAGTFDNTYKPDMAGATCTDGGFVLDPSGPTIRMKFTDPNTFGYMATVMTASGSCDIPLYTESEAKVADWVRPVLGPVHDWCNASTVRKVVCGAGVVAASVGVIYLTGGAAAPEAVEADAEVIGGEVAGDAAGGANGGVDAFADDGHVPLGDDANYVAENGFDEDDGSVNDDASTYEPEDGGYDEDDNDDREIDEDDEPGGTFIVP